MQAEHTMTQMNRIFFLYWVELVILFNINGILNIFNVTTREFVYQK